MLNKPGSTMTTITAKTYKDLLEYKELTPIHGKPDVDTLSIIFQQLKRNAQCIPTTIGGGRLGYLGLVLKPQVYMTVPNSAVFIRPQHPGPFVPTGGPLRTAAEVAKEKMGYEEELRLYNECNTVEQLLQSQLIDTMPHEYLDSMRNADTDMIIDTIPDIIDFLVTSSSNLKVVETLTNRLVLVLLKPLFPVLAPNHQEIDPDPAKLTKMEEQVEHR